MSPLPQARTGLSCGGAVIDGKNVVVIADGTGEDCNGGAERFEPVIIYDPEEDEYTCLPEETAGNSPGKKKPGKKGKKNKKNKGKKGKKPAKPPGQDSCRLKNAECEAVDVQGRVNYVS